jgi:hypothetical protein
VSDRAAVDLQNEYLLAASMFEQQLRIFNCLDKVEPGKPKPWAYCQGQILNNLIAVASCAYRKFRSL